MTAEAFLQHLEPGNQSLPSSPGMVEEALRRNAGREGRARVEDVGIYSVAKRLVRPMSSEGFHECFEVMLAETGFVVRVLDGG